MNKMSRMHIIYAAYKIARERIESFAWSDQNAKELVHNFLRVFALK